MKQIKILLINPPLPGKVGILQMPLGLCYVAAYARKSGFDVKILDTLAEGSVKGDHTALGLDEIKRRIADYSPDMVGVTCSYTVYEAESIRVAEAAKAVNPAIITVAGGAHTSANPKTVLASGAFDLAVIGEGEETLSEIARNLQTGLDVHTVRGTAFKKGKEVAINERRPYIEDIDSIPFPARDLLDAQSYLKHPSNSISTMRTPTLTIISSRGCPYNCIFCSIQTVWGRKWRGRSAQNVVAEMELLHKEYGVQEFRFFDDNMTFDRERLLDICKLIISRKLDIRWDTPNGVALGTLDEEMLRLMKKSGYYRTVLGIESGTNETLKFIRKPFRLEKAEATIRLCDKVGLWTWSTFVFGFPDEKREDVAATINYAVKSGLNFATFYIAQPYAGTELYDVYLDKNLLPNGDCPGSSVTATKYDTIHLTAQELNQFLRSAMKRFILSRALRYINPVTLYREFLSKIRTVEDLRFVVKMMVAIVRNVL